MVFLIVCSIFANEDDDKDQDWKNLGTLLKLTGLWTPEARDLYTSLSSGNLKG